MSGQNNTQQRNAGLRSLDPQTFMYEVAEEIRAGLRDDQKKAQTAGLNPQKPFDKQVKESQGKSSK